MALDFSNLEIGIMRLWTAWALSKDSVNSNRYGRHYIKLLNFEVFIENMDFMIKLWCYK